MTMDKPIVPREIRKVFEGRVFSVAVESVTLPRGQQLDVEVVRHPGSVVLLPLPDGGVLLLVGHSPRAVGGGRCAAPGEFGAELDR